MKYAFVFQLVAWGLAYLAIQSPWCSILFWPALAFLVVSIAYFTKDVRWFGKRTNGSRAWLASIVLLPYLAFARIVWEIQVALDRTPPWHAVNERVILARRLKENELPPDAVGILDLTSELLDPLRIRRNAGYYAEPVLDAGTLELTKILAWAEHVAQLKQGKFVVHCANGSGRTGHVAAIWLIAWGQAASAEEAIRLVQAARPSVRLNRRQTVFVHAACDQLGKEIPDSNTGTSSAE